MGFYVGRDGKGYDTLKDRIVADNYYNQQEKIIDELKQQNNKMSYNRNGSLGNMFETSDVISLLIIFVLSIPIKVITNIFYKPIKRIIRKHRIKRNRARKNKAL